MGCSYLLLYPTASDFPTSDHCSIQVTSEIPCNPTYQKREDLEANFVGSLWKGSLKTTKMTL